MKPEERNLLIAVLAALALLLLLILLSPKTIYPKSEGSEANASQQVPLKLEQERYSIGNTVIEVEQEIEQDNGLTELTAIANKGSSEASISVIEVVPKLFGDSSDLLFVSPNALSAALLSRDPVVHHAIYSLPAGSRVEKKAQSRRVGVNASFIRIVTQALSKEEQEKLLPLLKRIALLGLTQSEAKIVQKQLNNLLNQAGKSFEEKLEDASDYVENIEFLKNPSQEKPPSIELFPELPEGIGLIVKETLLKSSTSFLVEPKFYLGSPLFRMEGEAKQFASVTSKENAGKIKFTVAVDLEPAIDTAGDNFIPFDEVKGTLVIGFASLLYKTKEIPVVIKVVHASPEEAQFLPGVWPSGEPIPVEQEQNILPSSLKQAQCSTDASTVISVAKKYLGAPYTRDPRLICHPPRDFSCACFVSYVFREAGKITWQFTQLASVLYNAGVLVSRSNLIPGDIVFFETYKPEISHVGIYLGSDQMIHSGNPVKITKFSYYADGRNKFGRKRFMGAKRVLSSCLS